MTVETELDKFALHLIKQAMKPDAPLADATAAFKAATTYVQMKAKHKPDAPGEGTLAAFANRIQGAADGKPSTGGRGN